MKKAFYPNSFLVPLICASEATIFIVLCAMFSSQPYLIIGLLPLLITPILLIYYFRVVVDLETQDIRRIKTRIPLASAFFAEAPMSHGQGWNINDKNSDKRIFLPMAFYKHKTIENIKQIVQNKTII